MHVDVDHKLEELSVLIEEAKSVPLSASCMVNRAVVLDLIDDIRDELPSSLSDADELLAEREAVVAEGRREADRLIAQAREEQLRMLSQHEVYLVAVAESEALRAETLDEVTRMRRETDDYIDARLATFEITLHKTLAAVERGRDKLRGQAELEEDFADDEGPIPD
jgi:cell division septum initiation protein DivIVA